MPTAVPESIGDVIKTRLENITIANGYAFDVTEVVRQSRKSRDFRPRHHAIVVVQGEADRNDSESRNGNPPAIAYELPFTIHGFVRQADATSTAKATGENEVAAAIHKAIANGATTWHTFGGYAYNAMIGGPEPFDADDEHSGVSIEVEVQYRVSELDPFTVRA